MTTSTPPPEPADELIARLRFERDDIDTSQGCPDRNHGLWVALDDAIARLTSQQRELADSEEKAERYRLVTLKQDGELAAANARVAELTESHGTIAEAYRITIADKETLRTDLARVTAERDEAQGLVVAATKANLQLVSDAQANTEISRFQASRIRELLARLGEPHAPHINQAATPPGAKE